MIIGLCEQPGTGSMAVIKPLYETDLILHDKPTPSIALKVCSNTFDLSMVADSPLIELVIPLLAAHSDASMRIDYINAESGRLAAVLIAKAPIYLRNKCISGLIEAGADPLQPVPFQRPYVKYQLFSAKEHPLYCFQKGAQWRSLEYTRTLQNILRSDSPRKCDIILRVLMR